MVTKARKDAAALAAYHHGNLRETLLDAVEAQLADVGAEAVSLRAAARAAGVSGPAVFRHFADKRAVMTAIAVRAHEGMATRMTQAASDARARGDASSFEAIGRAYLDFALDHPARFQVMFRAALLDGENAELRDASASLIRILVERDAPPKEGTSDAPSADALHPVDLLPWAAVHGMATLAIERALPLDGGALRDFLYETLRYLKPSTPPSNDR